MTSNDDRRDSRGPASAERWPTALDYVLTSNLFAVVVAFALSTELPDRLAMARLAGLLVLVIGMALILVRLNRPPEPVTAAWRKAWGQVLTVHLVSGIGTLVVVEANIILG